MIIGHYDLESKLSEYGFDDPLDFDHNEFIDRFMEDLSGDLAGYNLDLWGLELLQVQADGSVYAQFGAMGEEDNLGRWDLSVCRIDPETGRRVVRGVNPFIDGFVAGE